MSDPRKLAETVRSGLDCPMPHGWGDDHPDPDEALDALVARAEAAEKALREIADTTLLDVRHTIMVARDFLAADLAEPDYRAELAELRAQVRYLADDLEEGRKEDPIRILNDLRELVGDWPHEKAAAGSEEA